MPSSAGRMLSDACIPHIANCKGLRQLALAGMREVSCGTPFILFRNLPLLEVSRPCHFRGRCRYLLGTNLNSFEHLGAALQDLMLEFDSDPHPGGRPFYPATDVSVYLPEIVAGCPKLKSLALWGEWNCECEFAADIPELTQLAVLTSLAVHCTWLKPLPEGFWTMTQLRRLSLGCCWMSESETPCNNYTLRLSALVNLHTLEVGWVFE